MGYLADVVAGVPLRSNLLGICDGGCGTVWRDPGRVDGFVAAGALSSFCAWGI